jgi:hypothetical protein
MLVCFEVVGAIFACGFALRCRVVLFVRLCLHFCGCCFLVAKAGKSCDLKGGRPVFVEGKECFPIGILGSNFRRSLVWVPTLVCVVASFWRIDALFEHRLAC